MEVKLIGFYLLTGQAAVLLLGLLYIFLVLVCGTLFIALIRQKLLVARQKEEDLEPERNDLGRTLRKYYEARRDRLHASCSFS